MWANAGSSMPQGFLASRARYRSSSQEGPLHAGRTSIGQLEIGSVVFVGWIRERSPEHYSVVHESTARFGNGVRTTSTSDWSASNDST